MSQRENNASTRLRDHVCRPADRWDRVENGVLTGMPDVNYVIASAEGWIELKAPHEPAKETTALFGSAHGVTLEQRNWLLAQHNAGGRGFLFIATERRLILMAGELVARRSDINTLPATTLEKLALWTYHTPVRNVLAWADLRELLQAPIKKEK